MSNSCLKHVEFIWRQKTKEANEDFEKGNYQKALNGYKEALTSAEVLDNHKHDAIRSGIPFMQIFAISYNNISVSYEKNGEVKKGLTMLKRVVDYFLILFKEDKGRSIIIQRELTRAYMNYKNFGKRHNINIEEESIHYQIQQLDMEFC